MGAGLSKEKELQEERRRRGRGRMKWERENAMSVRLAIEKEERTMKMGYFEKELLLFLPGKYGGFMFQNEAKWDFEFEC